MTKQKNAARKENEISALIKNVKSDFTQARKNPLGAFNTLNKIARGSLSIGLSEETISEVRRIRGLIGGEYSFVGLGKLFVVKGRGMFVPTRRARSLQECITLGVRRIRLCGEIWEAKEVNVFSAESVLLAYLARERAVQSVSEERAKEARRAERAEARKKREEERAEREIAKRLKAYRSAHSAGVISQATLTKHERRIRAEVLAERAKA